MFKKKIDVTFYPAVKVKVDEDDPTLVQLKLGLNDEGEPVVELWPKESKAIRKALKKAEKAVEAAGY